MTHPQIRGPRIEIQIHRLRRRPDRDLRQIHRVVLDVLGGHLAHAVAVQLLLQHAADVGLAADPDQALHRREEGVRLARLLKAAAHEVRALLGRGEAELAQQVDVGLGARGLVSGVADELDPGGHVADVLLAVCRWGCRAVDVYAGYLDL